VLVPTLQVTKAQTQLGDLGDRTGAPNIVGTDISGAKNFRSISAAADVDVGCLDTNWYAVRWLTSLAYVRKTTEQRDTPTLTRIITSYERNELAAGLRADLKLYKVWEFRLYGGPMTDGLWRDAVTVLTAGQGSEARNVEFVTPANRFRHGRVGFDALGNQTPFIAFGGALKLSPTRIGLAWNAGRASHVPLAAEINGEDRGFEQLLEKGAQGVLSDYVTLHPTGPFNMTIRTAPRGLRRIDLDLQGTATVKPRRAQIVFEFLFQHRHYQYAQDTPLGLRSTEKRTVKATIPLLWRFQLVGTYEYQKARIVENNDKFTFSRFEFALNLPMFLKFGPGIRPVWR